MKFRHLMFALAAAAVAINAGSAAAAEKPRIAVILKTLSSQYWKVVAAGAQDAAKKYDVDLILLGPPTEDAVEQQINMVQDALSQHPGALVFSPSQPPTAVGVLKKAAEAKVPVILVDTGMPERFTDYVTFIGTDNLAAGKAGGEALAKVLKKGDKVILLDGAPGNPSMTDRVDGAKEVLEAAGIEVASRQPAYSDREKAFTVTQNILQSTPDIAGVFAGNDEEALGAMRALQQSGKKVPVIGVDANDENLKAILSGDLYGSIAQGNYQMGYLGIEKALDAINGKPVDKRIDSGATLVTKENAQKVLDDRANMSQ
ncbi:sugar ABC transporter substrate-binding protein [Consotaella salsifontis]|uniref:Monosaccharide ABC transporter substrate-binding protein, CUT2 family n=1 Tax=Consotaella salsifontis TaxID=1365950 RepID=A0A1T4RLV1_9HYPH|nr:sugar ABC transporter substrate-binding protein [Consotaella salsifontis]SKA16985.1 monosaccharide ABC transporter substrate-binding protein, CUT2 family [Consotaella salsifontis]